ncbi:hypothetical protein [Lactococcus garvieae]|jgi:hypothetical protein|uniref:Uncharacterized protein n=1 Tax=Lactococcus garvieae DCC43 TaxID=1231377 RepID=K2NX10_9LACT|nr:hypothetical protein [Lactococcus garvieae]EKF52058.1 hypothetical protein C426_0529 [Lactococcus garvieae DCC43]QPS70630.1 hypothetical protein I6G50_07675 [Lactococcus garvieae]
MNEGRRVVFPIIGDDEMLEKDTRVIMTNTQLITKNPSQQDEASFSNVQMSDKKRSDVYKPVKTKVSYSTQHRPLNSNHSGYSSFDKMPKKTSVDESKEKAKREAAVLPKRPKDYVHPLERDKDDFSMRRSSAVLSAAKPPTGEKKSIEQKPMSPRRPVNNNPIRDMKKRGLNLDEAVISGSPQKTEDKNKTVKNEYFDNKRKNLFDRGF